MRILAFSNCPLDPLLGSGQTRLAWSGGLRALGHEVTVVDSEKLVPPQRRGRGYRWRLALHAQRSLVAAGLENFDLLEFFGAEFWLATWWAARHPARQRPLIVAHSDGLEPAYTARLALSGAERVSTSAVARLGQRLQSLAFSRADHFVTGSESDRQFAARARLCPLSRSAFIPLGLKPEFLSEPPPAVDSPARLRRVIFLGRWTAAKGHRWVAKVMSELLANDTSLELRVLGVGDHAERVRADFPPALHGRIHIRGRLTPAEIQAECAHALVFFQATEFEGFGLALAEAMASGCAAVTTPTGFGAALRDGAEALICPFGDTTTMSAALRRLLSDESLRLRIAVAGQQRARQLRWETSVAQLEKTYLHWLDEKSAAAADA